MKRLLFRKSFTENFMDMMQKAQNSHGNLIPVKKMGKDGVNRTYWISPEDMNQGKMKGQQNLFGDDEMDQTEDGTGFFSELERNQNEYQIKPLLETINKCEPLIAGRIQQKYSDYIWDKDTKELDIKLDMETAWYMKHIKDSPKDLDYYQKEYNEKTDRMCKQLNNRKLAMARLKKGSVVAVNGEKGKITGFSKRGFPIVLVSGEERKMFVDEIVNINELIEKYGKTA